MCSRYTYKKDEAKLKLPDQILVFGFVPRGDIRPTDLGPVTAGKNPETGRTVLTVAVRKDFSGRAGFRDWFLAIGLCFC